MRKHKPKPRVILPDPHYNDVTVANFVNHMMWDGKKSTAFSIFYDAMNIVKTKTNEDNELDIFQRALFNVTPNVEVRSRRVGGSTFQIPTELSPKRKTMTGIKWLITFARKRSGKGMAEKLAAEIMAAAKGEGSAVKRREDTQKMADANKAFAHYKA